MYKRLMAILMIMLCMSTMCVLTGCSGQDQETDTATEESVTDDSAMADSSASSGDQTDAANAAPEPIDVSSLSGADGIDVDLTTLSATMVYSVVNDMLTRPNEYIGKTIKMTGSMSSYHDEQTDNTYYACIIKDATACCAQGIEFILKDDSGYPADGEDVTVTGTYDLYTENNVQYCVLKEALLA